MLKKKPIIEQFGFCHRRKSVTNRGPKAVALCGNVTALRYVFYSKIGRFVSADANDHLFFRFGNGSLYTNALTCCTESCIINLLTPELFF